MLEGEMLFELEGDPPRVLRSGETFWEPGGDRIHFLAANPGAKLCRFVAIMACRPGEPMLTLVEPAELEERCARRHAHKSMEATATDSGTRRGDVRDQL